MYENNNTDTYIPFPMHLLLRPNHQLSYAFSTPQQKFIEKNAAFQNNPIMLYYLYNSVTHSPFSPNLTEPFFNGFM